MSGGDALAAEVAALRSSVTVASGDHVACLRVRGDGAATLLDRVSPGSLFVRPGKMSHTVFLDDEARPIADVYVCCDEDDFFVLAEGLDAPALIAYLAPHADPDVALEDLTPSHAVLCLGGPYAWELLGELTTPDVIGLPYLGFFHHDDLVCFRGGKTGEYGYDLLVPRDQLGAVKARLAELGDRYDLAAISLAALELAGLENFFWNARRQSRPGLTPIELQLQWRVNYARSFPGDAALARRRATATRRAVLVAADAPLAADAEVSADGRAIGTVLHADRSPTRGDHLAVAVIDRALAHAGLDGLIAGGVPVRTLSAPSINNRSLYVEPQRHSYATRATDSFPPLVRG